MSRDPSVLGKLWRRIGIGLLILIAGAFMLISALEAAAMAILWLNDR